MYNNGLLNQVLISKGADINAETDDGQTPFDIEILDTAESKCFTAQQLKELKETAKTAGELEAPAAAGSGKAKKSSGGKSADHEDGLYEDISTMTKFFREAGT